MKMEKHFVTFYSPGTVVAETSETEIDSWDVPKAVEMSKEITERYGAKPYGFTFSTRTRDDNELDSHISKKSGTYYLGGEILTLEQLKAQKDPRNEILISNMECNGWKKVVINTNSWEWTQPLHDGDVVL